MNTNRTSPRLAGVPAISQEHKRWPLASQRQRIELGAIAIVLAALVPFLLAATDHTPTNQPSHGHYLRWLENSNWQDRL